MSTIKADRSGESEQDDRYGWSTSFVPMLARVTREWPPRDGLTFGIYGPWGSGKSTVLNLLESRLQQDSQKYPNTYVVRFNPWFYDSPQALVMSFFSSMGATLSTDKRKKWSAAGDLLKKLGVFLSFASKGISIAGIGLDAKAFETAAQAAAQAGEVVSFADAEERSLRETRDKLLGHLNDLGDAGGRIIVLIDDVDRLDSDELFTLLRLLRTIADLPSITLLISMDEHRVSEILNSARGSGYGRAYLEKIVQAHVHVPMPAQEVMDEQLRDGIANILREARGELPEFPSTGEIPEYGPLGTRALNRIVRTPRDVVRYLNGLRILTLARPRWDLDATDAMNLAALHVFYPEVYERLRRSKHFVTRGGDQDDNHRQTLRTFDWLLTGGEKDRKSDPDSDRAAELIREMFGDVGARPAPGSREPALSARRIASPEVFDSYFALDAEPEWISRSQVRTSVGQLADAARSGNRKMFVELLRDIAKDQRFFSDLMRSDLVAAINLLSVSDAVSFAECLLDASGMPDERTWNTTWNAVIASTSSRIRSSREYDVTRDITVPIHRWIERSPDESTRKERMRMFPARTPY